MPIILRLPTALPTVLSVHGSVSRRACCAAPTPPVGNEADAGRLGGPWRVGPRRRRPNSECAPLVGGCRSTPLLRPSPAEAQATITQLVPPLHRNRLLVLSRNRSPAWPELGCDP